MGNVCTSQIESLNQKLRLNLKRFTRLTLTSLKPYGRHFDTGWPRPIRVSGDLLGAGARCAILYAIGWCGKILFRRYDGIKIHDLVQPGDVQFVYHTYRGLLLWFVQDEHRMSAPPNDAKTLLARLLRFNLSLGMLSYGLVFVPFLAIGNYITQLRLVNKQIAQMESGGKNAG